MAETKANDSGKITNFAVPPLTFANKEYLDSIMALYEKPNDKKIDTLIRIMQVAEHNQVKGLHPELAGKLKSIDGTIDTLIKQINGIVAGQDSQVAELTEKLDKTIEEKRTAIETAAAKSEVADAAIKQAQTEIDAAKVQAKTEIERANAERDQAIRERDDARTIASEKTASNDLLMKKMTEMENQVEAYKKLQNDYRNLQMRVTELEQAAIRADSESALAIERAVIEKEREMMAENARLAAKIELLEAKN